MEPDPSNASTSSLPPSTTTMKRHKKLPFSQSHSPPPPPRVQEEKKMELSAAAAAAANDEDSSHLFVRTVSRILHRVDCTEGHEEGTAMTTDATTVAAAVASDDSGGPLSRSELNELSLLCCRSGSTAGASAAASTATAAAAAVIHGEEEHQGSFFAAVEGDQLVGLVELLHRHINRAVSIHFVEAAAAAVILGQQQSQTSSSSSSTTMEQWLTMGEGRDMLVTLRCGLEAAGILLCVVTTPGIDRRAVNEDAIEASITLLRLHLSKHLIAALNNTGYFLSNSSTNTDSNVVGTKSPSSSSPPALKKRRRSVGALSPAEATSAQGGATSVEAKDLKKAYKLVTATTVTLTLLLMDRLEALIRCLPMNEQQVLLVTSGCLPAVEIHCQLASSSAAAASNSNGCLPSLAHQLQVATNGIWTAAFRHYPTLRGVLLEDLSSIIFKLPTGKRSMRSFPVRYASLSALETWTIQVIPPSLLSNVAQEPHCIQMITSLLLSLVHACVTKPTIDCNNNDEADAGQDQEHQKPAKFTSGLRSCHTIAVSIVSLMLKQCNNGKAGGSIEYRQIFSHMVDDMLLVLTIPEYPAAELLLLTIQRRLNHEITATSPCFGRSSTQKQPQLEVMYLNFAFDILGKIGAVQARLLAVARDKTIQMTNSESLFDVPMSNSSSGDQKVTCYCNTKDPGDMMVVQCDRCHALWHGPCVGIDESNSAPDEWFCDACTLGNIQQRTKSSLPHSESGYIDFQYTMRACVHAMVTNQPSRVDIAHDAAQFCLARWVDEIERKALVNELDQRPNQIVGRLLDSWDYIKQVALPLSDDGRIRVILSLMTQASPFFLAFKKQLQLILSIMSSDNGHSWRKLSLKVVEKCVEGDQTLMLLPIVTNTVSMRLADESISVREAAVALVGNYIDKSPHAIQNYQAALIPCLTDSGVSVRKRAVKIFESILVKNPHFRGSSEICNVLLQRSSDPKEEDGVRDLIDETFCKLWLRDGTESISQHTAKRRLSFESAAQIPSIPGVVTPNSPEVVTKRRQSHVRSDFASEQMMEVVRTAGSGADLEALLKKLLNGTINSDSERKQTERQKRQALGQAQCNQLVESLFALLVVIDEQRNIRNDVGKDLAATLTTIGVFANVSPHPILKHLDTITLYLKADNGVSKEDESSIVCATCDIMFRLIPAFDKQVISRLTDGSLAQDLTKVTYKFGPSALAPTIRAFSALANKADSMGNSLLGKRLLVVVRTFYAYAANKNSYDDFSVAAEHVKNDVHRALTVLGLICEFRDVLVDSSTWENEMEAGDVPHLVDVNQLNWNTVLPACFRLFSRYLKKVDIATKCKALAALKGIFIAHPQLLLLMNHVGLFDEVTSDEAGEPLQLEALDCWRSILEAEEDRIDSGKADAKMDADGNVTVSKRISGDQNGDATLFGGVLTSHANRLFGMTQSRSPTIRFSTLRLLGLLLRQGLVNPNEAVPYLFALQGDVDNNPIRNMARTLLMAEGEKRPDILRQRISIGMKLAYKFQKAVYPKKSSISALVVARDDDEVHVQTIFDRVFEECIGKNQKQRRGLYDSLLRFFEINDEAVTTRAPRNDLSLLSFVAQILAHLPYSVSTDPLFLVHHIINVYTVQGLQIHEKFADLLLPHGLFGTDELEISNDIEDTLEKAAKCKFPSRSSGASSFCSNAFPIAEFVDVVREGAVLVLLLRLKNFLCASYNLSLARCAGFDPNSKERLCDKGMAKVKFSAPFGSYVASSVLNSDNADTDKDALIRQYAEIRRCLRDEKGLDIFPVHLSDDDGKEDSVLAVD